MPPHGAFYDVTQFHGLPASTFEGEGEGEGEGEEVLNKDKKDGCPNPHEQLPAVNPTEACNLAPPDEDNKTSLGSENSGNEMRQRTDVKREHKAATGSAYAVAPSPRQLEEATTVKTGLAEQLKWQMQFAFSLSVFSGTAIINAKSTMVGLQTGPKPVAGGSEVHPHGFFYLGSIGLWFVSVFMGLFVTMMTNAFYKESRGLVKWSKIVNCFNICVAVLGVAFWFLS